MSTYSENKIPPLETEDMIHPRSPWRHLVLVSTSIILVCIASTAIGLWYYCSMLGVFNLNLRLMEPLMRYSFQDNSIVFDRNDHIIGEYFDQDHIFVPYAELPQHFINALIAIEDRTFFHHQGVDYKGIARAVLVRLKTGRASQGASTITQQVVRNVILNNEKTLERKILEIAWSLEVEKHLSKEKILEIYTNSMFLGNGAYGVGAAAKRYFGKPVKDLTPAESAVIAGLFQSPSRYNPAKYPDRAKLRQLQVIKAMVQSKMLTTAAGKQLGLETLEYHQYRYSDYQTAWWFMDYIHEFLPTIANLKKLNPNRKGLRIHTTLDSTLQKFAEQSIQSYEPKFKSLESHTGLVPDKSTTLMRHAAVEASILVTDPVTGDILAMVGGRDFSKSQYNRASTALRSPGSAFKPVVYTEALLKGFKWSDVIYVSPVNVENYRPKNMEDDYLTETTMMRAFYKSMNSPTVEIAAKVGIPSIVARAKKLGIQSPVKNEVGTAIGSSDVTMLDMARLYGTFATDGILTELSPISKITTADGAIIWERSSIAQRQKRVLNAQIAYLMTQGMRAVLTSGTGIRSADLADFAAGKTGTTNNSADNWFCGYTTDLVAIVWAGTDDNVPMMANVTGGALALPIWDQFIRRSVSVRKPKAFQRPEGIVEAMIHPLYGHRVTNGARMFFLESNQPNDTISALESLENSNPGEYRRVFRH